MADINELQAAANAEKVLIIDLATRSIIIPESVTSLGVESDDDVLRLPFKIPRTYCSIDLAEFVFRINYVNANGLGDVYVVDDMVADEEYITFSWLVGRIAAIIKGDVIFNVCLKKTDSTGFVVKEFNSKPATLPVWQGLETSQAVVQQNPDVLENVLLRMSAAENKIINMEDGASDTDPDRHAEYFTITDDGIVALKPEYRGAIPSASYPSAISDNGQGVAGSKNSELPENIVIPEVVNGIAVTGLAEGIFGWNTAVKSIHIPYFISEIPKIFARESTNLHTVTGTENVKKLGANALYATRITKAKFPNLEELDGVNQFTYCSHLLFADLGNAITSIPNKIFFGCENLSCVHGGKRVVTVGNEAFGRTRKLRNLNFLPNLTQIGDRGFYYSHIKYDWAALTNCSFGANATVLQCNPIDFWSACSFVPCNTPVVSKFGQKDPRWANDTICNTTHTYGANGCNPVCAAMIYSTFENKALSSPAEFVEAVRTANPSLMDLTPTHFSTLKLWFEAVGYSATEKTGYSTENLQAMFDALASGAMVLTSADSNGTTFGVGHCLLIHGINENGEVLVQDTDATGAFLQEYDCVSFEMFIQNFVVKSNSFLIVTK